MRPRHLLVALTLVGSALATSPAVAHAKCLSSQPHWSLAAGEPLPTRATLYYFSPRSRDAPAVPEVRAAGQPLPVDWSEVSQNPAFTTHQLSFDAGAATMVAIELGGKTQKHPVRSWRAPAREKLSARLGKRIRDRWTCSHTDIRLLTVSSSAQAFRVEWFDVRNGRVNLGHGSSVFPRNELGFWSSPTHGGGGKRARIELGHLNCFGEYNVPAANLNTLLVQVTPLYRDGSEGPTVPGGRR